MGPRSSVLLGVALALLGLARGASAHPAPFSFLDIAIRDDAVHGTLVLHVVDVAHDLGIEPADRLLDPAEIARARDRVVALLATRTESLRPGTGWLPAGESSTGAHVLTAATVVLAPIVLVAWLSTGPQLGEATIRLVETAREASWLAIGVFVAVFVMVNAVVEEVVYRQVVYEAARSVLPPAPAVIVQAAAFATLHVEGFPAGFAGVGLAFLYGLALGAIRSLTGGLRLPIVAHIVADATIALLVLTVVL